MPNTYEVGADQVWSWADALASVHLIKFNGTDKVRHLARDLETVSFKQAQATYYEFLHTAQRPLGC